MKIEEKKLQAACFKWAWNNVTQTRGLLFSIENEASTKAARIQRKAIGVVPGVSDMLMLMPNGHYYGLAIELKLPGKGPSDNQKKWKGQIEQFGYKYEVVHGTESDISRFKAVLLDYLNLTEY